MHEATTHKSLTMRKLTIENGKFHMDDEIEEVVEGVVKKIGNGAMILSTKKYIGKKVYVLIRKCHKAGFKKNCSILKLFRRNFSP